MSRFGKDRIAQLRNRPKRYEDFKIGEDTVRFRALNLIERDEYNVAILNEEGRLDPSKLPGNKARLLAMCIVDDDGDNFMSTSDVVACWDPPDIDTLHKFCSEMNGLGAKAVEEAAGNS